jgi:hypothetical protein
VGVIGFPRFGSENPGLGLGTDKSWETPVTFEAINASESAGS